MEMFLAIMMMISLLSFFISLVIDDDYPQLGLYLIGVSISVFFISFLILISILEEKKQYRITECEKIGAFSQYYSSLGKYVCIDKKIILKEFEE